MAESSNLFDDATAIEIELGSGDEAELWEAEASVTEAWSRTSTSRIMCRATVMEPQWRT
jgi:hypothetical protein